MLTFKRSTYKRSAKVANRLCSFCGKPLGYKKQIVPWYGGCHNACLGAYNRKRNRNTQPEKVTTHKPIG